MKLRARFDAFAIVVALPLLIGTSCVIESSAIEEGTDCDEECPVGANRTSARDATGTCTASGDYVEMHGSVSLAGQCVGHGSCETVCLYPVCPADKNLVITEDEFRCEGDPPPGDLPPVAACEDIDCSESGECKQNLEGQVLCDCSVGYMADGLECKPEHELVWHDSSTQISWTLGVRTTLDWSEAMSYCRDLRLGNHDDWQLPSIEELRTLVDGCPDIEPNGECDISSNCYSGNCFSDACNRNGCQDSGKPCYMNPDYDAQCGFYWSSRNHPDALSGTAWGIYFNDAKINMDTGVIAHTACVRG